MDWRRTNEPAAGEALAVNVFVPLKRKGVTSDAAWEVLRTLTVYDPLAGDSSVQPSSAGLEIRSALPMATERNVPGRSVGCANPVAPFTITSRFASCVGPQGKPVGTTTVS